MIILHQGMGAGDFEFAQESLTDEKWRILVANAERLLKARSQELAQWYLRTIPFKVIDGINHFGDEFSILHAIVPLAQYEHLRQSKEVKANQEAINQIVQVLSELGIYIRFVTAELEMLQPEKPIVKQSNALKQVEINKLVNKYIGVSSGYLGDFSYRSHHEFYTDLELDINPYKYDGTTRERFIKILDESPPEIQARILGGILNRFPEGSSPSRTPERVTEIRGWIKRLESGPQVEQPTLRITSAVVDRALRDAQELMRSTGATSGVDRVHTALHGYLEAVCNTAGLATPDEASLTQLFKILREGHPAFRDLGPRPDVIVHIVRALATILDTFNPIRNKLSVAHPNKVLLSEPEAMLVINASRTILHYIDSKIYRYTALQTAVTKKHSTSD